MSVRPVLRWLLLTLLALAAAGVPAAVPDRPGPGVAVRGMPLLQRFTPDDYQAAAGNLAVLGAPNGMLYVGNVEGVLRFDGSRWDRLELPRLSTARALALGPAGQVYVGGYDQFGVITEDAAGRMQYRDLRTEFGLDPQQVSFADVWTVVPVEQGVYFQTSERLFYLADDGNHRQWPVSDAVRGLFPVDAELYARVDGIGLSRFVDGQFERLPGGEYFAKRPLFNVFDADDGLLLVGPEGFHRADPAGIHPLPGTAAAVFAQSQPYSGIRLPSGDFVFGSYSGELLHFSADLTFRSSHKIGAFTVLDLAVDRDGGIWAATENDLVRLRVPAPWSQFAPSDGLVGSVYDSAYHDGALWVATSQGVYRGVDTLGRVRFEFGVATAMEAYTLLAADDGLLIGDRDGLLWRPDRGAVERLVDTPSVYEIRRSRHAPDQLLAFADRELLVIGRDAGRWQTLRRWPLDGISVSEVFEASPTELWIGDYRSGVVRWRIDPATGAIVERRAFGAADGLPTDPDYDSVANLLDDQLYVVSGKRVFRLQGSRFAEVDQAPFNLVQRPWELALQQTPYGTYASTSRELWRRPPGSDQWQPVQLGTAVSRGYSNVHVGDDGMLRVVTWSGLLQFDPQVPDAPLPDLAVSLRHVERRLADGSVEALPLDVAGQAITLPAGSLLQLEFRMLSMEPGGEFRMRVGGLLDEWTDWSSSNNSLTLRNAGAGSYVLEVEGRTRSGRTAQALQVTVDALPPWWRTAPALLGGLSLLLLLLAAVAHGIARLRYHQYLTINRRLEGKIAERTAELEQANRRLAELATEDSLTGVANRRALEQALMREWERCRELQQPLSLVMVDVDHFKQYNDVHGHLAGDQQLIRVARILSTHARPVRELLARFGGEEFALVLPGIGIDEALQRAEAIRLGFATSQPGPTVSLGVASVAPSPRQVPDDLIRSADLALYAAKRAGRNRVMRAAPLAETPKVAAAL